MSQKTEQTKNPFPVLRYLCRGSGSSNEESNYNRPLPPGMAALAFTVLSACAQSSGGSSVCRAGREGKAPETLGLQNFPAFLICQEQGHVPSMCQVFLWKVVSLSKGGSLPTLHRQRISQVTTVQHQIQPWLQAQSFSLYFFHPAIKGEIRESPGASLPVSTGPLASLSTHPAVTDETARPRSRWCGPCSAG